MSEILNADWSGEEKEVIKNLALKHRLEPMTLLRQALRLYAMHDKRLSDGETCTYSGDAQRARDFAGPAMTTDSAPERIWAKAGFRQTGPFTSKRDWSTGKGDWASEQSVYTSAQYTRTDIAEAEKEAAVLAERERLLKAARELKPRDHYEIREAGGDYCRGVNDVVRALETAIRKGDDNG